MTDPVNESNQEKKKFSPTVIIGFIAFAVVMFLIFGNDTDTSNKSGNKLTADALKAKKVSDEISNEPKEKSIELVESEDNDVNYDTLAFTQLSNDQEEIQEELKKYDIKFSAFNDLLEQSGRATERAIISATSPIKSDINEIKRNVQTIENQVKIMSNNIAEGTTDGAFRFNNDAPGTSNRSVGRTDGLMAVNSGYVSFNDYSSLLGDEDGTIPDMIKEDLIGETEFGNSNKNSSERKNKRLTAGGENQIQEDSKYNYITINADSYVDAQLFHGIQCPIGGGASITGGDSSAIGPSPVIVKISGVFKGANGEINDIGDARLFATCIGRRTSDDDYGRAKISIKRLTYSNSLGEDFQIDNLDGYTVDVRDEIEDIKGPIDKVLGSSIFSQSIASAMSAIGLGFSSQQYSQSQSSALGTATSVFTGSVAKDMVGQTVGSMFSSIQQYWDGLMNAEVDRVMLPSGRIIRIIINKSFVIKEPKGNTNAFESVDDELYF